MKIAWLNDHASFVGGCEHYIKETAEALSKQYGVQNVLLYRSDKKADPAFLTVFDEAFPVAVLKRQLEDIQPDLLFVHHFDFTDEIDLPKVGFLHDQRLFCLRSQKLPYFSNKPCKEGPGRCCYPLGCTLARGDSGKIELKTLCGLNKKKKQFKTFDRLIVNSSYMEKEAILGGFDPKQVVHNPLYPTLICTPPKTVEKGLVVYVGQLIRGKGVDTAILSMVHLPEHYKLVIIGEGNERHKLEKLTKTLNLKDRVTFLGQQPKEEVSKWQAKAQCVVMPTRSAEPFGLSGLEAVFLGTPVVGSGTGGMGEWLIEGRTGKIAPLNAPKEWATSIENIAPFSQGHSFVQENFSKEAHIKKLFSLFESLIKKEKSTFYTFLKEPSVEAQIETLNQAVTDCIKKETDKDDVVALLMIGGYGKSEGGVCKTENGFRAHNNIDYLLITKRAFSSEKENSLSRKLDQIAEKHSLLIDFSTISYSKLKRSAPKIRWYDLYYGHHLIFGDKEAVLRLPFKDPSNIHTSDMFSLVVNRLTTLLINEWMLTSNKALNDEEQKLVVRHIMKAIVGMGDALLFALGQYHFSYREKQKRIEKCPLLSSKFKELHTKAVDFRFSPNYEPFLDKDLKILNQEILEALRFPYLMFESFRLNDPNLDWTPYPSKLFSRKPTSPLHAIWGALHPPSKILGETLQEKLGFLMKTPRERVSCLLPFIAFHVGSNQLQSQLKDLLSLQGGSRQELVEGYLKLWAEAYDQNFLRRFKSSLVAR